MTPPSLTQLLGHATTLPSLPEVVSHLIRELQNDDLDVDTLTHHINSDPAIVARLLAAANSVASGAQKRIHSASQAFLLLGANRVAGIILASSLVYRYDTNATGFNARVLWQHSLGTAVCARVLAEQTGLSPDMAFTSGLLHDIGQFLMYTASPAHFSQVREMRRREGGMPLIAAERSIFGYDHCEAGRLLATAWKLPTDIVDAIAAHHEPDGFGSEIGNLVHVSECLSHALDLGAQENNRVPDLSVLAFADLGLTWPKCAAHFAEIEARFDDFRIALGV